MPPTETTIYDSIRDWYVATYPDDTYGRNIDPDATFVAALSTVSDGYEGFDKVLGLDSHDVTIEHPLVRDRIVNEIADRFGIDRYSTSYALSEGQPIRKTTKEEVWKETMGDLVVLETRPGFDGKTDALLYDPEEPKDLTPYIIAHGFDAEAMTWQHGSYRNDLMDALCEFRHATNPKWAIPGCTPEDVLELQSGLSRNDAEGIARDVNSRVSSHDDLFSDEIRACVSERADASRSKRMDPASLAQAASRVARAAGAVEEGASRVAQL